MLVHLLLPVSDPRHYVVSCGAADVTHGTWVRSQVTCPSCLRPPCTCSPDLMQCPACREYTRTHRADGSKRHAPLPPTIRNETAFQEEVRQAATAGRWLYFHCTDSRKSPAGFPDTVCVRLDPSGGGAQLLFAELKMPGKTPTDAQATWLHTLGQVSGPPAVYCWYPADLPTIWEVLR
jgi:hypothetical protein